MIKLNKFAFMGAIALGAVGFTACSSDDLADDPGKNPSLGDAVKTQFAINIPYTAGTRLGTDIVQGQETPVFRGMSKIKLIPGNAAFRANTAFTNDAIMLGDIAATGALTNGAEFYQDVAIPVGTSHFLFYAEATAGTGTNDKANGAIVVPTEFNNGDLLNGGLDNTSALEFNLKQINTTGTPAAETFLLGVLNGITSTLYTAQAGDDNLTVAYDNFVTLTAGSGASILEAVQNLYDIVKDGGAGTAEETVKNKILEYFSASSDVLSYKTDASGYDAAYATYPVNLGLPAGAAQVEATAGNSTAHTFAYDTDTYQAKFANYAYPASLYYFVNTTAKTDDEAHEQDWSGSSAYDWGTFITTNYDGTKVTATTQSVVLADPVQYSVARFDVSPKFAAAQVPDQHNVNREVGNNFQLTGILVGGQNPVDYSFTYKTGTENTRTIYDASITATNITNNALGTPFYTLVLESEKFESGDPKTVNFALEFKNNGEDFYGKDGQIVPAGGTFYLVGQLSTHKNGAKVADYVFQQDHHTVANVTINSLKDAYNTVPDLRKTELEFGLYVDLTWEAGLTQDVVIE